MMKFLCRSVHPMVQYDRPSRLAAMKGTILAVDDDPILLEMYKLVLENEHTLHLAASGADALSILEDCQTVDVVLLDIMMPGIDGYEVCRRIRSNKLAANVKIILVSSKMMLEDRLLGYEVGADDYMIKPFEAGELLAKIRVYLRLKNVEEINQVKTNLLNLLHHETRTPLTAIFGYTRMLREDEHLSTQQRAFVDAIQKCGEKLLQSCEEALLLSELKLGRVPLERMQVPLALFFSEYRQRVRETQGGSRSIRFTGDETLFVYADLRLFTIAIGTLIDNAVKYAREGSIVDVSVHTNGNWLRIEVANEGEKLSREQQAEIFNLLSVTDIAHHHQGCGLSLAISRQIIEAHDGRLTVANHDAGPVFTVELTNAPAALSR